jgi:hypothetical protein
MEVMVMIGAFAGQIRDIRSDCARGMIERGEAIDARALSSQGIAGALRGFAKGGMVPSSALPMSLVGERATECPDFRGTKKKRRRA